MCACVYSSVIFAVFHLMINTLQTSRFKNKTKFIFFPCGKIKF